MSKELEEDKKQINKMLDNIYDGLEFEDDEEIRELYLKQKHALKTALNYIENSIPKKRVEEKIEETYKENLNYSENEYYLESEIKGYAIEKLQELLEGK